MRTLTSIVFALLLHIATYAQKNCGTSAYQERIQMEYPDMLSNLKTNVSLSAYGIASSSETISRTAITIPVVVHIVYYNESENISNEQVASQIEALNRDFNRLNADFSKVPSVFSSLSGVSEIRFELAKVDPNGRATSGITRTKSSRALWTNDDKIKSAANSGVTPWDSKSYLNIWVSNLAAGLVGYSSAPGSPAEKDGVVIRYNAFGTLGSVSAPYNAGRTAVHEIGHWLNLKHIWGESQCGSDEVDDTPQQRTYSQGCPNFPKINTSCPTANPNGEMFMNFMDFSNDDCMMMFTEGQIKRMRLLFGAGGVRSSILVSKALGEPWNTSSDMLSTVPIGIINVKLFPNPTTGILTIENKSDNSITGKKYQIYATDGRAVAQGSLTGESNTISVASLTQGIYFIRIGEMNLIRFAKQS
ncbi:MAG: M43 family zinc metalloprotease [Chitinophagaceae bacterium]